MTTHICVDSCHKQQFEFVWPEAYERSAFLNFKIYFLILLILGLKLLTLFLMVPILLII